MTAAGDPSNGAQGETAMSLLRRFGFWAGVLAFGVLLAGLIVALWDAVIDRARNEEVLTVLLTTMLLLLLVSFALVAMAFKRAGLAAPDQALGLPQGSVRALIAFVLLLIFAMLSIFLFERVDSVTQTIEGVTPTQFEDLDLTTVVEAEVRRDEGGAIVEYRVTLQQEQNAAQVDLAKQITTALITLVAALAAFYFGARTTATTTDVLVRQALGHERPGDDPPPPPPDPEDTEVLGGHPVTDPDEDCEPDNTVG